MIAMDEREERDKRLVPGYRYTAFGFLVNPETEERDFGVTMYACPTRPWWDDWWRDEPESFEQQVLEPINMGDKAFPVVIRRLEEKPHAPTVLPQGGSSGCWAITRKNGARCGPGVLTAKHVVRESLGRIPSIGDVLDLTDQTKGTILDLGPDGIDAALIATSEHVAVSITLRTLQLVPQWLQVEFNGARSGWHRTYVTQVTDTRGVFGSASLPIRVHLAEAGLKGDSGALVTTLDGTTAVAIYMGALSDLAGRSPEGYSQHAYQIEMVMDTEMWT